MEFINSLSTITSPLILIIIIGGAIAMYRTGTLQYLLSKNTDSFQMRDKIDKDEFEAGKWRGEVSITLSYMQKDIQEIKEDSKVMRERLGLHLDDEEHKLDTINTRLLHLEKNNGRN